MTELARFRKTIDSDVSIRFQYLKILDRLMTDGEVTPEMTSVAAKKLGFKISAEEFLNDKEEFELSEDELDAVSGGVSAAGERAPDGRKIGCPFGFYFTWTDYWIVNSENRCPCGGFHDLDTRSDRKICRKCRLALDERGVVNCYDANGREMK